MKSALDFRCVRKLRLRPFQRTINRIHCLLEDDPHGKNVVTMKKCKKSAKTLEIQGEPTKKYSLLLGFVKFLCAALTSKYSRTTLDLQLQNKC